MNIEKKKNENNRQIFTIVHNTFRIQNQKILF